MVRTGPEHQSLLNPKSSVLSIMIVAGEASGDKHGASLARALAQLHPEIKFQLFGAGGEEMRAAGVETLVDAREVGIIGVLEIARAIGKLYRAYRTLLRAARSRRPSAVVLIDWPDFNMRLARQLHREGFKIIYYISPQVWAWRRYRIRALRRNVDRMLVILPFEEEFYKRAGLEVTYVGHPLSEAVRTTASREEFCRRHGLDPARPIFALLPGSRHKEIHFHLPAMLDAAIRLRSFPFPKRNSEFRIQERSVVHEALNRKSQISNCKSQISNPQFVVPLASTVRRVDVEAAIQAAQHHAQEAQHSACVGANGEAGQLCVTVVEGDTYNALGHSEFAVVASGTATVEAALAGTPMVIIYRGSELNWRLIRPLIHLDTFGMVNLIAGRRIVPELMQHEATGERIAREATAILSDASLLSRMQQDLECVRELLAADGGSAAERAAQAVIEVVREP
ncbi:MAG TPA: lipid-A-disaccharide synthase [Blastocatellia bacterium]|nr:lipid-A-disaccharide synthase [Blastocatellia bacterium]